MMLLYAISLYMSFHCQSIFHLYEKQETTIYYYILHLPFYCQSNFTKNLKKKKMFKNKQNNKYLNLTKKSETF
jgi:hypothetical protein